MKLTGDDLKLIGYALKELSFKRREQDLDRRNIVAHVDGSLAKEADKLKDLSDYFYDAKSVEIIL